jgi:hypothetical protein
MKGRQALPHEPQFWKSVDRLTQVPLHRTYPAGQVHVPLTQLSPEAQAVPQAPQWFGSVCRS